MEQRMNNIKMAKESLRYGMTVHSLMDDQLQSSNFLYSDLHQPANIHQMNIQTRNETIAENDHDETVNHETSKA